jgi:hypothetical protein
VKEFTIPWSQAQTLADRVIALIEAKQTSSEEFQTYLKVFGRERLKQIWLAHQEKLKQKEGK